MRSVELRRWLAHSIMTAAVVTACGTPAPGPIVEVHDRVAYTADAAMTVYQPDNATGAAVAVLLHGCCGDRIDLSQLAWALAEEGIVAMAASWTRLESGGGWPTSYAEAGCAVAVARGRAVEFGGDPSRVLLVGWSDGALLASVAGFGVAPSQPSCASLGSTQPDAVIALGGYFGLGLLESGHELTAEQAAFLGEQGGALPGAPASYLRTYAAAPTWTVTGENDNLSSQAVRWAAALETSGNQVTSIEVRGSHVDVISPRTPLGAAAVNTIVEAGESVADD